MERGCGWVEARIQCARSGEVNAELVDRVSGGGDEAARGEDVNEVG